MKCRLSTLAVLVVSAVLPVSARVGTQPLQGANQGVLNAITHPQGHHNSPAVHQRGVSALPKTGRPPRPELFWRPKKERNAKNEHLLASQQPAKTQKIGKMPGEGKRWKWKALNVTDWKGAPAKRMPGFHLRKKKPRKGKGKGVKARKHAPATPATLPGTHPQATTAAAAASPPPSVPASPPTVVWSNGEPAMPQPTSIPNTPKAAAASQFVFNPQSQTWVPAAGTVPSVPKAWATETLPPNPSAMTPATIAPATIAPAPWAPATAIGAFRGTPTTYPLVAAVPTFAPVAHHPAPAQVAPTFAPAVHYPTPSPFAPLPAQYQAFAHTTTTFWR